METTGRKQSLALLVGALGVVYGDIGTSPLYALRMCFGGANGVPVRPENVFGIISLIFWSLTLVVSVKYLALVTRADNKGEGGVLSLLSLAVPDRTKAKGAAALLVVIGVFGASLLYGDGMLTPAVTVLGAVEGLEVATPVLSRFVVPISVVILVILFRVQRFGTSGVGRVFGPVMAGWFCALALLGVRGIAMSPGILQALSPAYAVSFFLENGARGFLVLGSVFLAVTGAEGLFADMGHFGVRPIRLAWFWLVFPALLLNYLGEGGLLLANPEAIRNPFFMLAPSWALYPLVALSTLAAVIASQATISGAYSITMQAVQMGYMPRVHIQHTSHAARGQIYVPRVNAILMVACITLVIGFRSSGALANAYGIAVSLTMLATTVLFFAASQRLWGWKWPMALAVCGVFGLLEIAFVSANGLKILHGGLFPVLVGILIFTVMMTWNKGRSMLRNRLAESYLPLDMFLKDMGNYEVPRVPGTAVFLSGSRTGTPIALLHNLRHNKVLHEHVIILTIVSKTVPGVPEAERFTIEPLRPDIDRVVAFYGFMEQPDVPALLRSCCDQGLKSEPARTTFFLSRETILPGRGPGMAGWRRRLFGALSRNAQSAAAFFQLPPNRVVELGMQVEL